MAKKKKTSAVTCISTQTGLPPNLGNIFNDKYVVENLETGEKVVMDYLSAIAASYDFGKNYDNYEIFESVPNPNIKIYPIKDLGPAAKLLFDQNGEDEE